MKFLASSILAAASVYAQSGGPLSQEQRDIQDQSKYNNWYHDLTDRKLINEKFKLQYDELVVKLDVFTGFANAACQDVNNEINAGCQFIKLLTREMEVLAPHSRFDEVNLNNPTSPDRDLYCNQEDALCSGIFGLASVTKIRPSFTGKKENYKDADQSLNQIENPKGWNCIFPQAGPVSCLFLGDISNCVAIHNILDNDQKATQHCDQGVAKEYCWRHGAELALPDFVTLTSVIEPLCQPSANEFKPATSDNYVMSTEEYWLDAKKVIVKEFDANSKNIETELHEKVYSNGEYFNILTNSKFSLLGKFQHTNRFLGIQNQQDYQWQVNDYYSDNLTPAYGRRTDYELLLRSYSEDNFRQLNTVQPAVDPTNIWSDPTNTDPDNFEYTNPNRYGSIQNFNQQEDEYFSTDEAADGNNAQLDTVFDMVYLSSWTKSEQFKSVDTYGIYGSGSKYYYKNLFGGVDANINEFKQSMIDAATDTDAKKFHGALSLHSVRDTLGKKDTSNDYVWNKNCMVLECDSRGTVEYKVLSCDQLGVRPLCVMDSFISVKAVCPSEAGVDFCGDNVHPFLMTTVYGNLVKQYTYNSVGGIADEIGSHKLGNNGLENIASTAKSLDEIKNKSDNVISALNRYLLNKGVQNADGSKHQRELFMRCDTINDAVDGPAAIEKNNGVISYKTDYIKSYNRVVCENAGWQQIPNTNRFTYTGTKTCKCDCPNELLWENVTGHKSFKKTDVQTQGAYVHNSQTEIDNDRTELRDRINSQKINVDSKTVESVVSKYDNLKSAADVNALTDANDIEFHCCPEGFEFQSDAGYDYGHIAIARDADDDLTNDKVNSVHYDCGISYCKESATSSTGLFWSPNTIEAPKKQRVDIKGTVHTDGRVHGRCVPLQCLRPKCSSSSGERYDQTVDSISQLYEISQFYNSCRCPCDGTRASYICTAYSSFKGLKLYEPPIFDRSPCGSESCRAPQLAENQEFEDLSLPSKKYNTGESLVGSSLAIRVRCLNNRQLACRPGFPGCDKDNGIIRCERNTDDCVKPMINPYICEEVFCENPCDRDAFDIEVNKTAISYDPSRVKWSVGDVVPCKCKEGLQQDLTDKCTSTCTTNGLGQGVFLHNCQCTNTDCSLSCDIPNANQYTNSIGKTIDINYGSNNKLQRSNYLKVGAAITLYDHVFMQCKEGFDLRYTHNDEKVGADNHDKCARQCYRDPKTLEAKLDHIACYCSPRQCPVFKPEITHENDNYNKEYVYWPNDLNFQNRFNEVCSKCKGTSFSTKFGHMNDCVECKTGRVNNNEVIDWTDEGQCVEQVCPDPRGIYGARMTATARSASLSMNLKHTITSMDRYVFPAGNDTVYRLTSEMKFPVDGTTPRLGFAVVDQYDLSGNEYLPFYQKDDDSKKINAVDGVQAQFTCMKGFSPYLNWAEAVEANNFGAMKENYFRCTCKNGKWCCTHHCRCDKFCPKPKCVGC